MIFDYSSWTALLAEIVQPDGKVDYEALAERRPRLAAFVRSLATVSPDAAPVLFPTAEDALAYWLNAYNAFVLVAIVEEYPIRSVWKTRDGQFFERPRHVAGGALLSLNDIEHRILRGRFRDPRIHFAINFFTIYSNGVRARALLRVLESDARSEAVLNYSIYRGRDAEPLPGPSRELLEAWSRAHPLRLFSGYKVLYHAGAAAGMTLDRDRESDYHGHDRGCLLCFPVLTSRGRFHACPFAIESTAAHYALGDLTTDPATVFTNYRRFRLWAQDVLDPAARARGISSCEMCARHVETLPRYG